MTDRRGTSRSGSGHSYKDPVYDDIETRLEKKHGLPSGIMRNIRTRGERSNADQVSEAGAATVYQVIPATRALFKKRYGVDAYSSKEAAAEVAALHLKESFQRGGDWNRAVAEYHGGPDPRNWGARTRAYVGRAGDGSVLADSDMATIATPAVSLKDFSIEELLNMNPADLGNTRRPLGPQRADPRMDKNAKRDRHVSAVTGGDGLAVGPVSNNTNVGAFEQAEMVSQEQTTAMNARVGFGERIEAMQSKWFGSMLADSLDAAHPETDPGFADYYLKNWDTIESFAESDREVRQLREATSQEDLIAIQQNITQERATDRVLDSSGNGTAWRIASGLLDPAGWAAGFGTGKAFQVAGVGSNVLAASGRTGATIASMAAEGALGNVAMTAALDAAGEFTTTEDYAISATTGLAIGAALSPLVLRGGKAETAVGEFVTAARQEAVQAQGARLAQAQQNLGPRATAEQLTSEVHRLDAREKVDWLNSSLADVPDDLKLLSHDPDRLLTADPDTLKGVEERGNLSAISDDAERGMVAEHLARSEAILAANPVNPAALNTVLRLAGWESTGLRLLASESPVAKAVGTVLLEGTTGAAGRRRTAAMALAVRERLYNRHMIGFDSLYHQFRKGEGVGVVSEAWNGRVRRQFNSRVFAEIEARAGTPDGQTFDPNPAVLRAADMWESGMHTMRLEQQHVDAVGAARLGMTSRGYMTHRLDPASVLRLTAKQQQAVRDILTTQFIDPKNGFDEAFAKRLATKYLERAMDKAKGGYDVPMNLHSPEAADIVRDSLEAMNLGADEVEKLMGKFSRGGASHTKRRLRLDLSADIGDGLKLQDLFNTDVVGLYRGYARRVAGEVALAQFGIMGKKGLNVLRKAVSSTGGSADDLKAFDQIAAEFLNTPFGNNHKYMDNIRIATSLSRLGGMGFTQLGEFSNALTAMGVQRTFSAIGALPRMVKEVSMLAKGGEAKNPILASIDTLGGHLGLDEYHLTRMFDVKDNDIQLYSNERIGVATRALRAAGNMQAILSGHRMITAVQARAMAEQIVRKVVTFAKHGGEDVALRDMGITPELEAALRNNLDKIAKFDGDKLLELDLLAGNLTGNQLMSIRDAIERGASQIIQRTYVGETGKWAHDGLLKMLAQFRTFSLTAVEKQWGRNRANYGALKSFMYLMGAMSFAAPIHIARVQAKTLGMTRKEREEYADRNLSGASIARATLNYASASGLLGDVLDVGMGFGSDFGLIDDDLAPYIGARGQSRGTVIGGVVAPGVGLLNDAWQGIHGNGHKLVKALPFANLPYVAPLVNGVTGD